MFYVNSDVIFSGSSVTTDGRAIHQIYSNIVWPKAIATFKDNSARLGGSIYGNNSDITFDGNSSVTFNNNEANDNGGAVFCLSSSHITFDGDSIVTLKPDMEEL